MIVAAKLSMVCTLAINSLLSGKDCFNFPDTHNLGRLFVFKTFELNLCIRPIPSVVELFNYLCLAVPCMCKYNIWKEFLCVYSQTLSQLTPS